MLVLRLLLLLLLLLLHLLLVEGPQGTGFQCCSGGAKGTKKYQEVKEVP